MEVQSLTPVRESVEVQAARHPDLRDVFLCHAWDDRQGAAKELHDLLEAAGTSHAVAVEVGRVVERAPRTSRWRVDEMRVAGGADRDCEIELKLTNYTVIESDLQGRSGPPPAAIAQKLTSIPNFVWAAQSVEAVKAKFAQGYQDIAASGASDDEQDAARDQLDAAQAAALKGR